MKEGEKDIDFGALDKAYEILDNNPPVQHDTDEIAADVPGSDAPGQLNIDIPTGATHEEIADILTSEYSDLVEKERARNRVILIARRAVYAAAGITIALAGIKTLEELLKKKEEEK